MSGLFYIRGIPVDSGYPQKSHLKPRFQTDVCTQKWRMLILSEETKSDTFSEVYNSGTYFRALKKIYLSLLISSPYIHNVFFISIMFGTIYDQILLCCSTTTSRRKGVKSCLVASCKEWHV